MYSIFFLIILSLALLILLIKLFKLKTNTIISISLSFLILYFIIKPELVINSAINGGKIFLTSIFPVMFPFMVICNFLLNIDGVSIYSKILGRVICKPLQLNKACSFPIITSWLCGYPLGAKYAEKIYSKKSITYNEFSRLINIATNIGPLFLIASVGTTMLSSTKLGYLLLIPSYLSPIILGFLIRKKTFNTISSNSNDTQTLNFGESIRKSIEDAALTILTLGGYIVIFSVLINILKESIIVSLIITTLSSLLGISKVFLESIFLGSIELTNGCKLVSESSLSLDIKLCVISFLSSFGGLSIIAQTYAFFAQHNISFKRYLSLKILQGIISSIIMFIICLFTKNSISTFATTSSSSFNFLTPSFIIIFITFILLILSKILRKAN